MKSRDQQLLEEAYADIAQHMLDNPDYVYLSRMLMTFYRQLKRAKSDEDKKAIESRLEEIHKQMRDLEIEDMKEYESDYKDLSPKPKVRHDADVDAYNVGPAGYR